MQESTEPFPPRYWWLKRIVITSIALCIGFFALMYEWRKLADRRMADEVARLHANGERVVIGDFAVEPVPDDQNAALSLIGAANAIGTLTKTEENVVNYLNLNATFDEATVAKVKKVVEKTSSLRSLSRLARFQTKTNWSVSLASPISLTTLPTLNIQRYLTNLLTTHAAYEHALHHDAETVEIMRDKINQADRIQQHSPFLVSHLVAIGISAESANAISTISADLQILHDDPATTQPTSAASKSQVRALIAELLDERAFKDGYILALQGERLWQRDGAVTTTPITGLGLPNPSLFRTIYVLDAVEMMRATTKVEHAVDAADYQTAASKMPRMSRPSNDHLSLLTFSSRIYSQLLSPSLDRQLRSHFRALTERRIAALRLAIRMYQLDHNGAYPKKLEDLVGKSIPALPADPLRRDGKTFGYVFAPKITNAPVIYSVGEDGIDNGGKVTPGIVDPDDQYRWNHADVFFPLAKPAPTTQPIPDEE